MAEWTVTDACDWLRSIAPAYAQYSASFTENDIDGFTLLRLGHEELKELGVSRAVQRTRLMSDIIRHRSSAASDLQITLRGHCSTRSDSGS